jgi:ankyrin repeat protein
MKTASTNRVKYRRGCRDLGSRLANAALCGTLSEVKNLVRAGAKIDIADRDGFTPLMFAIIGGKQRVVAYLIGHGADANRRNEIGQTALMLASQDGKKQLVEQLIRAGADVHAVDKEKRNAVSWAARRGDFPGIISTLGMFKADPDARDVRGMTPLMAASLMGYARASATVLLIVGANEKIRFRGKTAYQMASDKGHAEVCRTMRAVLKNRQAGDMSGALQSAVAALSVSLRIV